MIKLLVLLFTFLSVYAQETVFNLPDNHSRFLHEMDRSFKNASQILIITPSFHHADFSKKLLSAIKKGGEAKLIVQDAHGDPLSLIQYRNVDLYISSIPPKQTAIIVDDFLVCTVDKSIDKELFALTHSVIRCSNDPDKISLIRGTLNPFIQHAKPYLE